MKNSVVWIVDDEPAICWSLRKAVESHGHRAEVFSNAESVIDAARDERRPCSLLISDIRLPKKDGFTVAESMHQYRPDTPVILMTAFGDLSTALKATQARVFEYLVKPFDLKDAMRAIDKGITLHGKSTSPADFSLSILESLLLGSSPEIRKVYRELAIASQSKLPVLVTGGEGSPLESVASAIHRNSERQSEPFLSVIPSAISLSSLEREFVGSAQRDRSGDTLKTGLLGLVGEGTLFIDEIADLPRSVQLQLLRVLEHGNYLPFDGPAAVPFRGRVIASTTRELGELVESGEIDPRLEQRLRVHRIDLPMLDSRRADAVDIAQALLARARAGGMELAKDAADWITQQSWPGDVRQLRNCIENATAITQSNILDVSELKTAYERIVHRTVRMHDRDGHNQAAIAIAVRNWLHAYLAAQSETEMDGGSSDYGMLYEDFLSVTEPPLLSELFKHLQYNRAATAAKLGMHRSTLRQKMRKYELD